MALEPMLCFILTLVGGVGGWFANNWFSESRDRSARRLKFIDLAGAWRTKANRCIILRNLSADFPKDVETFGGAYNALEQDLCEPERSKFHTMCDDIVTMTDAEVETDGGKAKLLNRLEAILKLLSRN
jgi:hypothetical protein